MRQLGYAALVAVWLTGCAALDQGGVIGTPSQSGAPLGATEVAAGLREALATGTERTIRRVGRTNGFWGDEALRIPLPDALDRPQKILRTLGQDELVDEFHLSLNRAAERAVPEAATVFAEAIRAMTLDDARGILEGGDRAATDYFARTTRATLAERFRPVVAEATGAVGATRRYKSVIGKLGRFVSGDSLDSLDLDAYVTERALDGVFATLAEEEERIRDDPSARTTDLLRRVFGR